VKFVHRFDTYAQFQRSGFDFPHCPGDVRR